MTVNQKNRSSLFLKAKAEKKECYTIVCSNYCYIQIMGLHELRYEIMILTEIHYSQLKLLSNFLCPSSLPCFFAKRCGHRLTMNTQ